MLCDDILLAKISNVNRFAVIEPIGYFTSVRKISELVILDYSLQS